MGLVLFMTVVWPILYLVFLGYPDHPWGLALASILPAFGALLFGMNRPMMIDDTVGWIGYWDVILILTAVIASVLAAGWKFLGIGQPQFREGPLDTLYGLARRIRGVVSEGELSGIEEEIDNILRAERLKAEAGDENAVDAATLNVIAHRLENLIHDRRAMLLTKGPTHASPHIKSDPVQNPA